MNQRTMRLVIESQREEIRQLQKVVVNLTEALAIVVAERDIAVAALNDPEVSHWEAIFTKLGNGDNDVHRTRNND